MQNLTTLASIWGAITIVLLMLVVYRRSLTSQEKDWIPLTDYGNGSHDIEIQTALEAKSQKLTIPIRALGMLSWSCSWLSSGFGFSAPCQPNPRCTSKARTFPRDSAKGRFVIRMPSNGWPFAAR